MKPPSAMLFHFIKKGFLSPMLALKQAPHRFYLCLNETFEAAHEFINVNNYSKSNVIISSVVYGLLNHMQHKMKYSILIVAKIYHNMCNYCNQSFIRSGSEER